MRYAGSGTVSVGKVAYPVTYQLDFAGGPHRGASSGYIEGTAAINAAFGAYTNAVLALSDGSTVEINLRSMDGSFETSGKLKPPAR